MSEKQYRDKIASVKRQQASEESASAKAREAARKHRSDAAKERARISSRTSGSMARTYLRNAENAEKRAESEDKKVVVAAAKLGSLARDLATAESSLEREVQSSARRTESRRKIEARMAEQADVRRRQVEKDHAREVARLARPEVRYVREVREVPAPRPETLRVLYLTANPEMNLRTDAEVRGVLDQVRRATHRDLITIEHRPAATAEDLITGLNEVRPHVVHFSGHAGDASLLFDNGSVGAPKGLGVSYDLLARALAATSTPPVLLVLNGCDTLQGAEVLLESVGIVVAAAASISDLAASLFASKFYAAIASAQSVDAAIQQGSVSVDLAGLNEGWKLDVVARPDLDLHVLQLVRPISNP